MTWDTFWGPNLLQATLFAGLSAIVGTAVGLVARRWFRQWAAQMFGEQQRTTTAAEAAASRAGEAADASNQAVRHASTASLQAQTAGDNSRQANDAIEWLATELAKRDVAQADMQERIDRLLGARARQLAAQRVDPTGALIVPLTAGDDDDPTTVTGRHRLHTQRITSFDDGDNE